MGFHRCLAFWNRQMDYFRFRFDPNFGVYKKRSQVKGFCSKMNQQCCITRYRFVQKLAFGFENNLFTFYVCASISFVETKQYLTGSMLKIHFNTIYLSSLQINYNTVYRHVYENVFGMTSCWLSRTQITQVNTANSLSW